MNHRITTEKRAMILTAICEGLALNSACRMFKASKPNVLRLLREVGEACEDWHNRHFRNLTVARLELDEQWSYIHTHKERMTKTEKAQHPERGDAWLWASIDADSKAIINWTTGKRTATAARTFAHDLAARVNGRVQVTTDPLNSYTYTIPDAFGDRVGFAQEKKIFQSSRVPAHDWNRYRVDPLVGSERKTVCGSPNMKTATVSHIERFFLTVRQSNKRCARKTLAYSKKWDNHALMASIHIFVYNMVRKHETLKTTPAVALGIVNRKWDLLDVIAMTDEFLRNRENAAFEAAFESKFAVRPLSSLTYEPQKPKVPWYLDPESGGPNPLVKKPGVQYDEAAQSDVELS